MNIKYLIIFAFGKFQVYIWSLTDLLSMYVYVHVIYLQNTNLTVWSSSSDFWNAWNWKFFSKKVHFNNIVTMHNWTRLTPFFGNQNLEQESKKSKKKYTKIDTF